MGIPAGNRMLDAMGAVVPEDLLLDPSQRGPDGRDLRHDVNAVAVLLDHARQAAHLPLDPPQPLQTGLLRIILHGLTDTLQGYNRQCSWIPPGGSYQLWRSDERAREPEPS